MEVQQRDWFLDRFGEWRARMIQEAVRARGDAISYRGFQVGACALSYNSTTGTFRMASGSNFMPRPPSDYVHEHMAIRECADRAALASAVTAGGVTHVSGQEERWSHNDTVVALVVVGEPQEDSLSGLLTPTLHPCWSCRIFIQAMRETSPNTVFLGVTPDLKTQELLRMDELIALHATHWREQQRHSLP